MVKQLKTKDPSFKDDFKTLLQNNRSGQNDVTAVVKQILNDVKDRGDQAVFDYTRKFDRLDLTPQTLRVSKTDIEDAHKQCAPKTI